MINYSDWDFKLFLEHVSYKELYLLFTRDFKTKREKMIRARMVNFAKQKGVYYLVMLDQMPFLEIPNFLKTTNIRLKGDLFRTLKRRILDQDKKTLDIFYDLVIRFKLSFKNTSAIISILNKISD